MKTMVRNSFFFSLTSIVFSMLMSFIVLATPPTRPTNFTVKLDGNGLPPATAILKWNAPSDDTTIEYVVYMASITANGTTDFKAIKETFFTETLVKDLIAGTYKFYVIARNRDGASDASEKVMITVTGEQNTMFKFISEPVRIGSVGIPYTYLVKVSVPADYKGGISFGLDKSPDGMTITPNGMIEWKNPIAGTFVIVITASMNEAPKQKITQTYELTVKANTPNKFAIISKPIEKGCIDKMYVYEPKATVPVDGGTLIWTLVYPPDGMSIDAKTGRLTWTPKATGTYRVGIAATFIKGNDTLVIDQGWTIIVSENCDKEPMPPCAKVMGFLKDDNGNLIAYGKVKAIRLEKDNLGPSSYETTVKAGQWWMMVRQGTYKILFNGDLFNEEWYVDAKEMSAAKEVSATCGAITEVNANVTLKAKTVFQVVEGKVRNADGVGIPNVLVNFIIVERNGSNKEGSSNRTAKTDAQGNYRIEIPEGFTYIANAVPTGDMAQRYLHVFYDAKQNANEATRFTVTGPTVINFTLISRPVFKNGFAASLKDTNGTGLAGRIILIPVSANGEPKKGMARTVETDSLGNASFTNVIPGTYVMQGMPNTRFYAPGFYNSNGLAFKGWKESTRIEVGEAMITVVFNINLRPVLGKRGAAKLDGIINGRGVMKSDSPLQTTELAGAMIVAYDENDQIADYCISDNRGAFAMYDLGQGTYTLIADMVDYESSYSTITTDYTNALAINRTITLGSSVSSTDDLTESTTGFVFPQPATNTVSISVPSQSGNVNVELFSTMGITIGSFNAPISNGIATLDISALPSGQYTFKAKVNESNSISSGQLIIMH